MSEDRRAEQRAVIVGAGMAGVQTAVALREQGWTGSVTLLGEEPHRPYDRPPLSKAVLLGTVDDPSYDIDFAGLGIGLQLNRRATALRPEERVVETATGPVGYDRLVLATGAEAVTLPQSEDVPGVHVLRTLDDARRLRTVLAERREVVVVGAGWIGAEFATAAQEAECPVTVVEAAEWPLAGVLPPEVSVPMIDWYADHGVRLVTGTRVVAVEPGAALLDDGSRLTADVVVVGIGARPATDWLLDSGIDLCPDASICADSHLRTSLPDVYAVGDCASFPSARFGARLLVHHWDNALHAPSTVAANIVGGSQVVGAEEENGLEYDPVPYFWSEQFGRFVQYAGHHTAADSLLWRGDPRSPAWTVCWLDEDEVLVALLAVGRPRDLAQGRRLIERGARLNPPKAAEPSVPLKSAVT